MLVVVCLRPEVRTDVPLRLESGGKAIRMDGAPAGGGEPPAALLTALALKKRVDGIRVLALTVGPPSWEILLREALAHGADEVLRIWPEGGGERYPVAAGGSAAATRAAARAAAESVAPRGPGLWLCGDRSGDTGHECFGAFLAAALGVAFAHRAASVEALPDGWRVVVKVERGYTQEMELPRPAVVAFGAKKEAAPEPPLPAWMAALAAPIPAAVCRPPASPHGTATLRPPVPRVKRILAPGEGLDAEGRIRAMVALPAGGGGTVIGPEVPPEEQAARAARFLRDAGYL